MRSAAISTPAIAAILASALFMSGCGKQAPLRQADGMAPPPVAYGADEPATAEQLIRPDPQQRPTRNEDLLGRSEPRPADPFELPPGADNGR